MLGSNASPLNFAANPRLGKQGETRAAPTPLQPLKLFPRRLETKLETELHQARVVHSLGDGAEV